MPLSIQAGNVVKKDETIEWCSEPFKNVHIIEAGNVVKKMIKLISTKYGENVNFGCAAGSQLNPM